MGDRIDRRRCPEHLLGLPVTLTVAAGLTRMTAEGLRYAIRRGNLKATPFPAGRGQTHWQVRLGDLAEYTGKPFSADWLEIVEECLQWTPGKEVRRVA